MNAGVTLVEAYLRLNGYFTAAEIPVIHRDVDGGYEELTDLDIIAVRFPWASFLVTQGDPGPKDDVEFGADPLLSPSTDHIDILIGEVKEGRPRVNSTLRSDEALRTALARIGCVPLSRTQEVISALRKRGEAKLSGDGSTPSTRIRIVAFGDGEGERGRRYEVIPLREVTRFVKGFLHRNHRMLVAARLSDPALGLLHLMNKTEED
jgi:hypothetical protein